MAKILLMGIAAWVGCLVAIGLVLIMLRFPPLLVGFGLAAWVVSKALIKSK